MLKVYVAAGSSEAKRAAAIIERLRAAGVHVTYDWTPAVLVEGSAQHGHVAGVTRYAATAHAEMRGALAADVVWFLVPLVGSSGAGFEVGVAYHAGRIVVCSGPDRERFYFGIILPEYETDDEVLAWLVDVARGAPLERPACPRCGGAGAAYERTGASDDEQQWVACRGCS